MDSVVRITLQDGLMLPSGFVAPASHACVIFCRVPPDAQAQWLEDDTLNATQQEAVLQKLYGATWRSGNDDGSQYVVRSLEARVLTPAEIEAAPWRGLSNDSDYQYWFYHVTETGELQGVTADQF